MKTSKATVQWRQTPQLYITLEHEGKRVSIHSDGLWLILAPYQVKEESIFKYRLKGGSIVNLWHVDQAQRDAALTLLVNDYILELWEVFGHRAEPFTPREGWLPGILEQL